MRLLRACPLVGAAIALAAVAGCSTLNLGEKVAALPGWGPKPQIPTRMTDFWTDTVLYQPGLPGVRGFGGRIMFYNDSSQSPIMVDGTLTVFAYDESRGAVSYSAPDRKYIFPAEHLPKHYSKSELGHSYSFWLPWDEVGGPRKKICLIARFEPLKGQMILSQPCRKVLPGEPSEEEAPGRRSVGTEGAAAVPADGVRPAAHLEPIGPGQPLQKPPQSFTIDVPPRFLRLPAPGQPAQSDGLAPAGAPPASSPQASGAWQRLPAGAEAPAEMASPAGATKTNPAMAPRVASSESALAEKDASRRPPRAGTEPATRFERRRPLVQRAPIAPRVHDPVRRQPLPAAWLSSLPPTPRSDWQDPAPATNEDAGPGPR